MAGEVASPRGTIQRVTRVLCCPKTLDNRCVPKSCALRMLCAGPCAQLADCLTPTSRRVYAGLPLISSARRPHEADPTRLPDDATETCEPDDPDTMTYQDSAPRIQRQAAVK